MFLCSLCLAATVLVPGAAAFGERGATGRPATVGSVLAQPAPSPAASPAGKPVLGNGNWTKYMAVVAAGISGIVLLSLLAGLAIQAPGFRRSGEEEAE